MRTFFRWLGLVIVVLGVVIGVGLFVFDWSWAKGYVAGQAGEVLGRTVTIGDLEVDLALEPIIRASSIRIENVSWGSQPHLLELSQLMFQIDLLELLKGRIVLPEIELIQPVANLDQSKQGQFNWAALGTASHQRSSEQSGRSIALPTVERLRLQNGRLVYRDAGDEQFTVTVAARKQDDAGLQTRVILGSRLLRIAARSGSQSMRTGSQSLQRACKQSARLTVNAKSSGVKAPRWISA